MCLQVDSGRQWYVHVIYSLRSSERNNRHPRSLSTEDQYHHSVAPSTSSFPRTRRSKSSGTANGHRDEPIGRQSGRGTDLQPLALQRAPSALQVPGEEPGLDRPLDGASPEDRYKNMKLQMVALTVAALFGLTGVTALVCKARCRTESVKKHTRADPAPRAGRSGPHTRSEFQERRTDSEGLGNSEV